MTTFTLPLPAGELFSASKNGALFPTPAAIPFDLRLSEALQSVEKLTGAHDVYVTIGGYHGDFSYLLMLIVQGLAGVMDVTRQRWHIQAQAGGKKGVEIEIVEDEPTGGIKKSRNAAYKLEG